MMKRATLENKRRYLHKMDYGSVDKNQHKQVIDSHLEVLDAIDRLEVEVADLRAYQTDQRVALFWIVAFWVAGIALGVTAVVLALTGRC